MKLIDLTGQNFGRLTVLYRLPKPDSVKCNCASAYWLCLCECGNKTTVQSNALRRGGTKSCGCLHRERMNTIHNGEANPSWRGHGEIPLVYWSRIIRGAKNRGLVLEISIEDANDILIDQDGRCALTGQEISTLPTRSATASLDRINSSLGYVPGNLQWVHKEINRLKNNYPQDEFIELCRMVVDHAAQKRMG